MFLHIPTFSGAQPNHRLNPIDARGWHTKACMTNAPTRQQKQEALNGHTSLLLLLLAHASLRTKNKRLPIDIRLCFYYFHHAHHCVQKAWGYRSTYLSTSTTFHTCLPPRTKSKGLHRYVLQVYYLINQVLKSFYSVIDDLAWPLTLWACLLVFIRTRGSKWAWDDCLSRSGMMAPIDS
jgi:hypothetical protein